MSLWKTVKAGHSNIRREEPDAVPIIPIGRLLLVGNVVSFPTLSQRGKNAIKCQRDVNVGLEDEKDVEQVRKSGRTPHFRMLGNTKDGKSRLDRTLKGKSRSLIEQF